MKLSQLLIGIIFIIAVESSLLECLCSFYLPLLRSTVEKEVFISCASPIYYSVSQKSLFGILEVVEDFKIQSIKEKKKEKDTLLKKKLKSC